MKSIKKKTNKKEMSPLCRACYGTGNLGYGSTGHTISSFIMFYGTSVLGIPSILMGLTIAITSLWDGISDPIIGAISDHTRSKLFGRRLGHMLFATFALAINNVLLWCCPSTSTAGMLLWILVFLLLQETFNTFFATPYSALCIDIAPDYNDQTKTQGFKTVFYICGLILPSILMSVFMSGSDQAQFDKNGYISIALVNSALVIVCGLISIFGTWRRVHSMPDYDQAVSENNKSETNKSENTNQQEQPQTIAANQAKIQYVCKSEISQTNKTDKTDKKRIKWHFFKINKKSSKNLNKNLNKKLNRNLNKKQNNKPNKTSNKQVLKNILIGYIETFKKKDFRCVMLGYSVSLIATVFISSVGMHLFTFCFHFTSSQISALMFCLFGSAIISQMLWVNVVKKYDKKQTLIFALCVMLLGIAATSVTFLFRLYTSPNQIFWFVLACLFVCGVGSGALYSLPYGMYADVITMEQFKTGENNSGRYTGYYTFTYNFSNSIALLCIGVMLDVVGFDSSLPVQSLAVQTGLGRIVFFGAAIALTCAIIIFSKYSIKRSDVLKVQIKAHEDDKFENKNSLHPENKNS